MYLNYRNLYFIVSNDIQNLVRIPDEFNILGKFTFHHEEIINDSINNKKVYEIRLSSKKDKIYIDNYILYLPLLSTSIIENRKKILEIGLFAVTEKENINQNIISLHGSSIYNDDTLYVFLGPKESGKSTMIYLLNKIEGFKFVSNDYLEIKLEKDFFVINNTDGDKEFSFRSKSMYQIDLKKYQELFGTDKLLNNMIKIKIPLYEIPKFKRIYFIYPSIGKSNCFEYRKLNKDLLKQKLYKDSIVYLRNSEISCIDSNNDLLPIYIDDKSMFNLNDHKKIIEVIYTIISKSIGYELLGNSNELVEFILKNLEYK